MRWHVRPLPGLAVLLALAAPAAAQAPDFDAARREAVTTLQALIRLNTTNPPGNETLVAEYLRDELAREGIEGEIYALDPSRGNLVARIRGNGSKEPLLIMGHSDVVGVQADQWSVDPFAAEIRDGYLYGRGASDDKGMIAAAVQVMRMVKRGGLELDRDLILLVEAGEEGTTAWGIDYMVENHLDAIRAEFALNEGGGAHLTAEGEVDYVQVATAEKVPWRGIRLTARGTAGHGSVPRTDNAVVVLARAVAKLGEHQMPMRLNETTREYFKRLAEISPPEEGFLYRNLESPVISEVVQAKLREDIPAANSMLRTGISPNIIEGGFRYNVIPGEATATLDVRALPDEDMDDFLAELRRVVDDPAVEITGPESWRPSASPSPLGTDLFRALERVQEVMWPEAVTLPSMLTGATDSAQLRAAGIPTYGVGHPERDEDARAHGNDERIAVESLGDLVEYLYRTVEEVAVRR